MNPDLAKLQYYPFEKLNALKAGHSPPANLPPISLHMGEPKQAAPEFILDELRRSIATVNRYPITHGQAALRETIAQWLTQRFNLTAHSIDPERQVIPVNGTREALFAFAQCVIDRTQQPLVMMPNPFYQIYEGAALLTGAEPYYVPTPAETQYLPDFDAIPATVWQRCQLIYICHPGNPSGALMPDTQLQNLLALADQYDFIIAADECYTEIYPDENHPPNGLLKVAQAAGRQHFERCVVFHSLSKRSNVPGLRSGFVAGDPALLKAFLHYRTYHGCAMSLPLQNASIKAWQDETHVQANRSDYREKIHSAYDILADVMDISLPPASFYLWPKTPIDDQQFALQLYQKYNISVLPGSYLSRTVNGNNPGKNHIRIALVESLETCQQAAQHIRHCINQL